MSRVNFGTRGLAFLGLALLAAACLAALSAGPTAGAEPRWQKLGDRYVNRSLDRDEIKVEAGQGPFDAVKLRVGYRAVRFRDVKIHFADGSVQDVPVRRRVRRGGETRVIALDGDGPRRITRVVFHYETIGRDRGQAEVELWGRS